MACADVVTSTPSSVSNPIKITSPSSSVGSLPEGAERLHLGMIFCMLTEIRVIGVRLNSRKFSREIQHEWSCGGRDSQLF
eukprot:1155150-Pelagomonas_calceolata.AAC.7